MPDRLFPFLVVLTALDLGFVHATDIVTGSGLVPLWLLAAASPWLRRLQRSPGYRLAWNLGVVLVFTLLVRHATTTGLLYMLEDGLLLAVLCQVHLLNNVGERQRPDLIFFNSFLIAFVTSFFAPDLTWSVLFVAHAFAFVPALQVNVLVRRGASIDHDLMRELWRDGGKRTVAIGVATAALFVTLPRDFSRNGWLGEAMAAQQQLEAGLTEQLRLDNEFSARLGNEVVMRLEPASGRPEDVPPHWRAIAFSVFDGASWLPQDAGRLGTRFSTDVAWVDQRDGTWQRAIGRGQAAVRVRLHDLASRRLPCPLAGQSIALTHGEGLLLDPKSYGVLAFLRLQDAPDTPIEYTVLLGPGGGTVRASPRVRQHMSDLPEASVPGIVRDLASRLRDQLPAVADDEEVARASCDWLQQHRRYQLPGEPGFARNLGDFLVGSGAGHCEYFATALALLLRLQGVPCRLVGGYLAHEWDPIGKAMLARSRHAHAWVEALLPDGSWLTLDATPPADVMAPRQDGSSWSAATWQRLEELWQQVVGFDRGRRAEWLQALAALPGTVARTALAHPFWTGLALAPLLVLAYLRRRRRQIEPAILELDRAVRSAGLSLLDGETPRELLARAAAVGIPPDHLAKLHAAAQRHESVRYGRCEANELR